VVTEYGVAALYGKSVRQRVQALVNISDPAFRDALYRQARELNWI
jgi:4-hydroxybutyrate CoA-transferase